MKKAFFRLICLVFAIFLLPLTVFAKPYGDEEGLASPHIAVYNAEKGVFVYTRDAEKKILQMRYFEERTQRDIANEMGVSQMFVSRVERKMLARFREALVNA